ncbi:alpha/beta fold hydrolase [Aquibacillus halophilus]|uniref:Alpha/beta fold hydrolase n=1 Tax=Aquibacillus halophilus TaxID=930132 RepID=A0A6A8DIM2_9BACI|nr:alpha/beta hydrolase [Aquibacillus halophilus]MRH43649.1 alpha/beta fold hydrolase [Aquibacillus halophilus]
MSSLDLKQATIQNGETLGYRERSGGEKVVILVHGNMTSSVHWDLVLESMDNKYKLYAIDLRGFGTSSYHKPIETIQDFSKDLKEFIDHLGLSDFALVGWSLGGAVCQQFCIDYPGYCNRLLLIASASTRGYPFFGTDEKGLPDTTMRLKTLEQVKQDIGKTKVVQTAYDNRDHNVLKMIWDYGIYTNNKPDTERYEKYLDDMLTQRNLAETYQALNLFNISGYDNGLTKGKNEVSIITIPVLVIRGDQDLVVTDRMTKELLEDYQGRAEYVEMKNCGHSPLIDNLDQLLGHMEQFLEREEQST